MAGFTPQRWDHEAASDCGGAIYARAGGARGIALAFAGTNPRSREDPCAGLEIVESIDRQPWAHSWAWGTPVGFR